MVEQAQAPQGAQDYFDESYVGIDALLARAQDAGARRIAVVDASWQDSPLGGVYQVTCELETADGRTVRRIGRARPGDARVPHPPLPEADDQVETRAEARAVRAVIRTAYPTTETDGQPPWQRELQMRMRELAALLGCDREAVAAQVRNYCNVGSTTVLDAAECDRANAWVEGRILSIKGDPS